jgi:hypothetical protein
MGDPSLASSPHFQALFKSALQAYQTKTGITLVEHALAVQLQSCHSVESITTTLLQGEVQAFSTLQENDKTMISIKTIVSNLTTLSAMASLGDAVGLVRQKALIGLRHLNQFLQKIPPSKAILAALAILLDICVVL